MRPFLYLLLALYVAQARAEALRGLVVRIIDGDTIVLVDAAHDQHRIRLTEIDAPERAQPWGSKSRQALAKMIFKKDVVIKVAGTDRYGRTLGRIYLGDLDVNREMVKDGDAWAYRQYLTDPMFVDDEKAAREHRRGLWSLPNPVPPWDWRHGARTGNRDETNLVPKAFTCGTKRYCREMTSCAEAEYYLRTFGLSRLDGYHDGIPCESLCR